MYFGYIRDTSLSDMTDPQKTYEVGCYYYTKLMTITPAARATVSKLTPDQVFSLWYLCRLDSLEVKNTNYCTLRKNFGMAGLNVRAEKILTVDSSGSIFAYDKTTREYGPDWICFAYLFLIGLAVRFWQKFHREVALSVSEGQRTGQSELLSGICGFLWCIGMLAMVISVWPGNPVIVSHLTDGQLTIVIWSLASIIGLRAIGGAVIFVREDEVPFRYPYLSILETTFIGTALIMAVRQVPTVIFVLAVWTIAFAFTYKLRNVYTIRNIKKA